MRQNQTDWATGSYRNAVERYKRFRDAAGESADVAEAEEVRGHLAPSGVEEEAGSRIGLERDIQPALRIETDQLERGMTRAESFVHRAAGGLCLGSPKQ